MVLANTTSVGMKPKTDQTPIPKVCLLSHSVVTCAVVNLMKDQISGILSISCYYVVSYFSNHKREVVLHFFLLSLLLLHFTGNS